MVRGDDLEPSRFMTPKGSVCTRSTAAQPRSTGRKSFTRSFAVKWSG